MSDKFLRAVQIVSLQRTNLIEKNKLFRKFTQLDVLALNVTKATFLLILGGGFGLRRSS